MKRHVIQKRDLIEMLKPFDDDVEVTFQQDGVTEDEDGDGCHFPEQIIYAVKSHDKRRRAVICVEEV